MAPSRPEEPLEQPRRGRLKVYLGFAAGVGKTYRMLEEAHALQKRGVDVAVGLVESRQRPETEALVPGLVLIPTRKVEYRSVSIQELDLEAVIARRPEVVLVDEVPHTNAPGSKNKRRYQDVLALLQEGIDVICALDVQHLESLNDLVTRATGIVVRETVPDTFLKGADQVVLIDLSVEDLIERLTSGKVHPPGKVAQALAPQFRPENLLTLRELALREVAECLGRASPHPERSAAPRPSEASQRVMVCMSASPTRTAELLRRGSRMAGRFNTDWFVVHVQTPRDAPHRLGAEAQRHLLAHTQMAKELGAEVVRLESRDPAAALIDFARSHGVAHLVIGRATEAWWRQVLRPSVMLRLVREAVGLDLHVLSIEPEERGE